MTKTLAELQALCDKHGISVPPSKRPAKEPYITALRDYLWQSYNPGQTLPEQMEPMLLDEWSDLDPGEQVRVEADNSGYCVQEKHDGVRALLHITATGIRITGRTISEVNFRLSEFQPNVPHLATGLEHLIGTILDGELVCPKGTICTGDTITAHPLQAVVAILATTPENAKLIQERESCHVRFMAFDVIRFGGEDVSIQPLHERLKLLETAYLAAENRHLMMVETHFTEKGLVHELLLADGKEGTVWKRLDQPYEPGKRVSHWLKRKKAIEIEAVVTGFKTGTKGKGNENLIGAVEFGTVDASGATKPIAWVSSWTDQERERMTLKDGEVPTLDPAILGQRALIGGHDIAGKSGRYRHARIIRWLTA